MARPRRQSAARKRARARVTRAPSGMREAVSALAMVDPLIEQLSQRAYSAAERGRLNSDWSVSHLDANEETRLAIRMLRAASRNLERNVSLYRKWLKLKVDNVVHKGFELQSTPRNAQGGIDRTAARQIERDFRLWSRSKVSLDGKHNLVQLLRLWVRGIPRDGEVIIRRHLRGGQLRLETLEADYMPLELHSPRDLTLLGVQLDADNRPIGYWLSTSHPGSQFGGGWSRAAARLYPAADVIHAFMPDRAGQVRGVPWGTAAFDDLLILNGYKVAELAAARIAAARPVSLETELGQDAKFTGDSTNPNDPSKRIEFDGGPGGMTILNPGQKLVPLGSDHPKSTYGPFTTEIKRDISAGLDVSYHSLNSDLGSANYSSLRHGRADELRSYETFQEYIGDDVLDRVFGWWLDWYLGLSGMTSLPLSRRDKFFEHEWQAPKFAPLDPLKEAQGIREELALGLTTYSLEAAKRGHDFRQLMERRADDQKILTELGIVLEQPKASAAPPKAQGKPKPKPGEDDDDADEPSAEDDDE